MPHRDTSFQSQRTKSQALNSTQGHKGTMFLMLHKDTTRTITQAVSIYTNYPGTTFARMFQREQSYLASYIDSMPILKAKSPLVLCAIISLKRNKQSQYG